MKLVVGLGNPGLECKSTRHNFGWVVLDSIISGKALEWAQSTKFGAFIAREGDVLYIKPAKFYNLAGEVVAGLAKFYKVDTKSDLLVVCDDFCLPFGAVKTRGVGSDGGNNGLRSILNVLGPEFARVRLGTNNEKRALMGDSEFVLSKFSREEKARIPEIVESAAKVIDTFLSGDFQNHKTMVK